MVFNADSFIHMLMSANMDPVPEAGFGCQGGVCRLARIQCIFEGLFAGKIPMRVKVRQHAVHVNEVARARAGSLHGSTVERAALTELMKDECWKTSIQTAIFGILLFISNLQTTKPTSCTD